jgi:hypothetical protein
MTPLSDIMSGLTAPNSGQIRHKRCMLAMSVGDKRHYVVDRILPTDFVQSADAAGMPVGAMRQIFGELIDTVPGAITTEGKSPTALSAASRNGSTSWRGPAACDDQPLLRHQVPANLCIRGRS